MTTRLGRTRASGVFGLAVFLTGVLVIPFLHNLDHRDDHDHRHGAVRSHRLVFGGAGLRSLSRHERGRACDPQHSGEQEHGDGHGGHHRHDQGHRHVHDHEYAAGHEHCGDRAHDRRSEGLPDDRAHAGDRGSPDDRREPDAEHGRGSLEHLGLAVTPSSVFVLPSGCTLVAERPAPECVDSYVQKDRVHSFRARAPPA